MYSTRDTRLRGVCFVVDLSRYEYFQYHKTNVASPSSNVFDTMVNLTQVYMGYSAALFAATTAAVLGYEPLASHPQGMAAMLAFSPILFGVLLRQVLGDSMPITWPFHKEPFFGGLHKSFGFNLLVGFVLAVVPAYHLMEAELGNCTVCA